MIKPCKQVMEMNMTIATAKVEQVRRDFSGWLRRAADGERIVLTAHGEPQAALISLDDLNLLQQTRLSRAQRLAALEQARALSEQLHAARSAHDVDAVEWLHQTREERVDELLDLR
jgi:prevent-host-death family protein